MSGMRIDEDVELGCGRRVTALEKASAHQDHFAQTRNYARLHHHRHAEIGHRPERAEGQFALRRRHDRPNQVVDGVFGLKRRYRSWEVSAVQPCLPVDILRCFELTHHWAGAPGMDRNVGPARQLDNFQRVFRSAPQRHITAYRRYPDDLEFCRRAKREQDREGVILARIGIDDDLARRHAKFLNFVETAPGSLRGRAAEDTVLYSMFKTGRSRWTTRAEISRGFRSSTFPAFMPAIPQQSKRSRKRCGAILNRLVFSTWLATKCHAPISKLSEK